MNINIERGEPSKDGRKTLVLQISGEVTEESEILDFVRELQSTTPEGVKVIKRHKAKHLAKLRGGTPPE